MKKSLVIRESSFFYMDYKFSLLSNNPKYTSALN
jgi:hypothetical protein